MFFLAHLESVREESKNLIKSILAQLDVALDSLENEDVDFNARLTAYVRFAIEREVPQFSELEEIEGGNLTAAELNIASQITSLDMDINCCRIQNVNVIPLLLYRQWLNYFFFRASLKTKHWNDLQIRQSKRKDIVRYIGYDYSLISSILFDIEAEETRKVQFQNVTQKELDEVFHKIREHIAHFSFEKYISEAKKISEYPDCTNQMYGRPFFPDVSCSYYDAVEMLGLIDLRLPKRFPGYLLGTIQRALNESNDISFRLELLNYVQKTMVALLDDDLCTYEEGLFSIYTFLYLKQTSYDIEYESNFVDIVVRNNPSFYESLLLPYLNKDAFFDFGSSREARAYMSVDALLKAKSVTAYSFVEELLYSKQATQLKPPVRNYWELVLQKFYKELRKSCKIRIESFNIGYKWEFLCQNLCRHHYKNTLSNHDGTRLENNKIPDIIIGIPVRNSAGYITHVGRIIECKKSLYFTGPFDALNNDTTDKYIDFCDTLEYWILEKPDTFDDPNHPKVKYIFAHDLLKISWIDDNFKSEICSLIKETEEAKDTVPTTIKELLYAIDQLLDATPPPVRADQAAFTIRQYTLDGNFLKEFTFVQNAASETGLRVDLITNATSGRRNSAGGYLWKKCPVGSAIENITPPNTALNLEGKTIFQVDHYGEVVATFDTIGQAAKSTGISRRSISDVLKGIQKTAGGFTWVLGDKIMDG